MKYFYKDMEFEVPNSCYYPREDSELLAEILESMDLRGKKCLDIGCGIGFLATVMAKQGATVTASDINLDAIQIARKNAESNGLQIHAVFSDLFSNIAEKFDLIVFNPPYLPGNDNEKKEITYYGGKDGRETIEKFLLQAHKFLKKNGKILLLVSTVTGEQEVIDFAKRNGYSVKQIARRKVPWEELIIFQFGTSHPLDFL